MSEFDPPTPATPPKDDTAARLESALAGCAARLGITVRVVRDTSRFAFRIVGTLKQSQVVLIDEELAYVKAGAMIDLLQREMEDLQLKLHDNMAAAMGTRDVRGRQFTLSKEDKHTLHDMYRAACNEALLDFASAEHGGRERVTKYEELMGRLFR